VHDGKRAAGAKARHGGKKGALSVPKKLPSEKSVSNTKHRERGRIGERSTGHRGEKKKKKKKGTSITRSLRRLDKKKKRDEANRYTQKKNLGFLQKKGGIVSLGERSGVGGKNDNSAKAN